MVGLSSITSTSSPAIVSVFPSPRCTAAGTTSYVLPFCLSPLLGRSSSVGSVSATEVASTAMLHRERDWEYYPSEFGKYHLLAPLALGGMGALYLAVTGDGGLERMMVIRTVLAQLAHAEYAAGVRD